MKFRSVLFLFAFSALIWSPTARAQARQKAVGAGVIPLDANGMLSGVDMSASGITGTLTVGVPLGPRTDIFSLNNPVVAGLLAVSTATSSQGNITFNSSSNVFGDIGVIQPGGPFLLNLSAGATGTTVNFQGGVFATTLNLTGNGQVNFNNGGFNVTASNFAADGTLTLAPNTTLIGALTTTAGANTGTLSLGGASVLDGAVGGAVGIRAVKVTGGSNLAGVNATITGATNAFTLDLGTNRLNVGGALTIANGGPSGVVITTLASPTVFGNVRVTGATNLGPTLLVQANVPATSFIPVGTQFNIIQSQVGTLQSGTNGSVVTVTVQSPTNPLYSFSAVPAAGTIAGLVTIRADTIPLLAPLIPPPGTVLPPGTAVAGAIVPVLLSTAPGQDLTEVLAAINSLSDSTAVLNAVAQLAPSTPDLQAPLLAFQGSRQFQRQLSSRFDDVDGDQAGPTVRTTSTCVLDDLDHAWWAKGFGYFGDQGVRSGFEAYDSRILGTMVGHEKRIDHDTRAGLAVGFANSKVNGTSFATDGELDTLTATAYAGRQHDRWFTHGDVSIGINDFDGRRDIAIAGLRRTALARAKGHELTGFVETGYRHRVDRLMITPLASLQYTHLKMGGYTETGAGDINLRVDSRNYDYLESGLGVSVTRPGLSRTGRYVPEAHARWYHELANPAVSNTASFSFAGSPSFTTTGLRPADDTYNVGLGLTLVSCATGNRNCVIEAIYDHDWRNDRYSADAGTVKATHRF